ncbi:Hg(II)-responsive transcriptional regulator [Acidihalobacter prosperus]
MNTPLNSLTIGRLAKVIGVNVETIRFYQRKGLLREPVRPRGGIRHYNEEDIARVLFIKSAQRLGFSLEAVSQLLLLEDGAQCSIAAELASRHLEEVRVRIQNLERIESTLSQLLKQCEQHQGEVACPLISALHAGYATQN